MIGNPVNVIKGLRNVLQRRFALPGEIEPGVYHYRRDQAGHAIRLHLRVDPDGSGLLMVNASGVLHLNATAIALMKPALEGSTREEAVAVVRRAYRVTREEAGRDYDRIFDLIRCFETTEDACPFARLDAPVAAPFLRKASAPYRADLALSYACNNRCQHCYVARPADSLRSLDLLQWKQVLETLWNAGVPHVCFTGGEATLSPDLVPLVEIAEDIGLVTGLLTNGRRLADTTLVRDLCAAGLDHVQITLESHDAMVHDDMVGCPGAFEETVQGIRNMLEADIYLLTNTTLCTLNEGAIEQTIAFLKDLGVRQFAMNSIINTGKAPGSGLGVRETDLEPLLGRITDTAEELGLRFIWYTPTHYCVLNPVRSGLGYKRCSAAEYNICVEPDGAVIPCQSYYEPAGNLLTNRWEDIWNSPLFKKIRNREVVPPECRSCPDFEVCGAGCPLGEGDRFLCAAGSTEG